MKGRNTMLEKFYFTYGNQHEAHPFPGGWTTVYAENMKQAIALFRMVHPDRTEGFVNCSWFYSEESMEKSGLLESGNFGLKEVEVIRLDRQVA